MSHDEVSRARPMYSYAAASITFEWSGTIAPARIPSRRGSTPTHEFILVLPNGYDTMLTERGANLSQGQRQMITIARAMVADPKMMILDEATSNVDTRTERLIQDGIRNLMSDKTSFSIAHRLATIRDSNRIMVLNGGAIEEMASHDDLMAARGFYYALYMSQFQGKGPGGDPNDIALDFVST